MMIKTNQEALDMLNALKQYLVHGDIINIRTPLSIKFAPKCTFYSAGITRNKQVIQYHISDYIWEVNRLLVETQHQCLLTSCERNDLEHGDIAYMTDENEPDFEDLDDYYIILSGDEAVHWMGRGNVALSKKEFNYIYRVEIG